MASRCMLPHLTNDLKTLQEALPIHQGAEQLPITTGRVRRAIGS